MISQDCYVLTLFCICLGSCWEKTLKFEQKVETEKQGQSGCPGVLLHALVVEKTEKELKGCAMFSGLTDTVPIQELLNKTSQGRFVLSNKYLYKTGDGKNGYPQMDIHTFNFEKSKWKFCRMAPLVIKSSRFTVWVNGWRWSHSLFKISSLIWSLQNLSCCRCSAGEVIALGLLATVKPRRDFPSYPQSGSSFQTAPLLKLPLVLHV